MGGSVGETWTWMWSGDARVKEWWRERGWRGRSEEEEEEEAMESRRDKARSE